MTELKNDLPFYSLSKPRFVRNTCCLPDLSVLILAWDIDSMGFSQAMWP